MRRLLSLVILIAALFSLPAMADAVPGSAAKQVPVMLINDVYRLDNALFYGYKKSGKWV